MRKFLKVGLCGAAALMMFATGCSGQKSAKDASQAESTAEGETPAETEEYVAEGSITLGEYKGIPVTVTEPTVTDEEVDAQIQQLLNSSAEYLEVDREAQLGDQVNIDYKGMKDGVAFDGGTAEGYDLVLGSNSFIDGFESGLVGAKKGEEVTLNLTFPDPYQNNPDLAGQAVVFEVKVNNVKEKTVPELTDDFVAKVSPEDGTVEKLRENMKAFILEQKQYQIDNQRNTDILNAVIDKSEIVCATDDVDKNYETQVHTEPTVTDEEVDAQIQQLLNSSAEYLEVDREAQLGDQVNIDYKGMKDGVAFDGGTAEGYDLVLGSNSFIDGFESGLVGAKKGEEVTLNLTFPDPYQNNPDLAGQAVVFEVKVNNVKEKTVPELTDDFVAKVSPEDGTVEKLRENMKAFILEQKQYQIDNQRNTDILNAVIDKSEIVCATDDVDKNYETQVQYYTNQASMYGLDLATYASLMGMDEEGLKSELRNVARDMTKQEMLLKEIASRENITVTDEDREALAERYGYDSLESFLETADKEIVDDTALMQKTLDFLVENAEITVTKGDVAPAS